jgi:hypothetical protein
MNRYPLPSLWPTALATAALVALTFALIGLLTYTHTVGEFLGLSLLAVFSLFFAALLIFEGEAPPQESRPFTTLPTPQNLTKS